MDDIDISQIVVEDIGSKDLDFQILIRQIDKDRDKFITVMYEFGFKKNEIAYMLNIHPSRVTRRFQKSCRRIVDKYTEGK